MSSTVSFSFLFFFYFLSRIIFSPYSTTSNDGTLAPVFAQRVLFKRNSRLQILTSQTKEEWSQDWGKWRIKRRERRCARKTKMWRRICWTSGRSWPRVPRVFPKIWTWRSPRLIRIFVTAKPQSKPLGICPRLSERNFLEFLLFSCLICVDWLVAFILRRGFIWNEKCRSFYLIWYLHQFLHIAKYSMTLFAAWVEC